MANYLNCPIVATILCKNGRFNLRLEREVDGKRFFVHSTMHDSLQAILELIQRKRFRVDRVQAVEDN